MPSQTLYAPLPEGEDLLTVDFDYIKADYVKVFSRLHTVGLDQIVFEGVELTAGVDYSWLNAGTIQLVDEADGLTDYLVKRVTPLPALATQQPGALSSAKVNLAVKQALHVGEEAQSAAEDAAATSESVVLRTLRAPAGETPPTLPPLAGWLGTFLSRNAEGQFFYSEGTGNDPALRGDFASSDPLKGIALVYGLTGSLSTLNLWERQRVGSGSEVLATEVSLDTGQGYVGKGSNAVSAAVSFAPNTLILVDKKSNTTVGRALFDGTNAPAPTANWTNGRQKGGALFATGTSIGVRNSGLTLPDATYQNFPSGPINLEFYDRIKGGNLTFLANQTLGGTYAVPANVEHYYTDDVSYGVLHAEGYTLKSFSFNYANFVSIQSLRSKGGVTGQSAWHTVGGEFHYVGSFMHDGHTNTGAGAKWVDGRKIGVGMILGKKAGVGGLAQVYGSHAHIGAMESTDAVGSDLQVDAYQARDNSPTAEAFLLVDGEVNIEKVASADPTVGCISVRPDNTRVAAFNGTGAQVAFVVATSPSGFAWAITVPANIKAYVDGVEVSILSIVGNTVTLNAAPPAGTGNVIIRDEALTCPIKGIRVGGRARLRGGFSGLLHIRIPHSAIGPQDYEHLDVDAIANGGYIAFAKGSDFRIGRLKVGPNVRQGMVLWTDTFNRDGTFEVSNLSLKQANSAWTPEPLLRLGYAGAFDFSEFGAAELIVQNWEVNGTGAASLQLIDVVGTKGRLKKVTIRNIKGRGLTVAAQIVIDLTNCTNVILNLEDIDIRNAAGAPLGITIINPTAVIGGTIKNVTCAITGRPEKCYPLYKQVTHDLSAQASGASAAYTGTFTGFAAGDRLEVRPRTARMQVELESFWAADTYSFTILNSTAGVGGAAEVFDLYLHKKEVP